jgi:hypothetical protein
MSIAAVPAAFLVVGLFAGESEQAREARFQKVRDDCARLAAAAVLSPGAGTFSSSSGAAALRITKDCMASKGF